MMIGMRGALCRLTFDMSGKAGTPDLSASMERLGGWLRNERKTVSNILAFPSHGTMGEVTQEGMSLRDYFAAGVCAAAFAQAERLGVVPQQTIFNVAKLAYAAADEMLRARDT